MDSGIVDVALTASTAVGRSLVSSGSKQRRPPAPPAGKIGYEPEVAAYKVYLVNDLSERRLLGQTTAMSFKDQSRLRPGELRTYAVTAVQRSGIESGMSERVELRVPDAK